MGLEVRLYTDFGTGEPWVARLAIGLPELVDSCKLDATVRSETKDKLFLVVEAIGMAFEALRDVERLAADTAAPELSLGKAYANLYGHLWQARKDRWQKVGAALGYKLGFIFQNYSQFERGATVFSASHPTVNVEFVDMTRRDRSVWQHALSAIRNQHLEHRVPVDPRLVRAFFRPDSARTTFDNVWQAIEEGTMLLLEPFVADGAEIVEIPEAARDAACPKRYGWDVPSLRAALGEHPDPD